MSLFETFDYSVIKKAKKIEIREYESFNLATTRTPINDKLDNGFSNVFDYISGKNDNVEKIKMTVPVVSLMEDDYYTTSFVVPRKYEFANIPVPSNLNVKIENIEKQTMVCIRFSGKWDERNFEKNNLILEEYIKKEKLNVISKRHLMRYNPPFLPAFLRKNEICYRINQKED